MNHRLLIFSYSVLLPSLLFSLPAKSTKTKKTHSKQKVKAEKRVKKATTPEVQEVVSEVPPVDNPPPKIPKPAGMDYRINSLMGLQIFKGSAFVSAIQGGFRLGPSFYVGPELNFALYSNASILSVLPGAWREWRLDEASKLGLSVGILGGVAFASGLDAIPMTTWAAYFDTSLSQDIDELAVLRVHFRPGMVGRNFAFMMNLSVGFRL